MATQLLLIGFLLGLSVAIYRSADSIEKQKLSRSKNKRTHTVDADPPSLTVTSPFNSEAYHQYPLREAFRWRPYVWSGANVRDRSQKGGNLVDNWQKSIIGLVELSKRNLESANVELKAKNYAGSVRTASASVENISRALIHCFGGKPDLCSSQTEALKLLVSRFSLEEKRDFEEVIDNVTVIFQFKETLKNTARKGIFAHSLNREEARHILRLSSSVIRHFQRILVKEFGEEIPLLTKVN
jgi:HEPN domain-containing protein